MKKKLLQLFIFSFLFNNAFPQTGNDSIPSKENKSLEKINGNLWTNDTIVKKGVKYRVSNLSVQASAGAAKIFFDDRTKKYLSDYWGSSYTAYEFFKFIFCGANLHSGITKIIDSVEIGNQKLNSNSELDFFNMKIFAGYNIDLSNSIYLAPYAGLFFSSASINSGHTEIASSTGYTIGLSINKYFTLKPYKYLGAFIGGYYNRSNYDNWNSNFGNYFYAIEIGLEYKWSVIKKIKSG